MGGWPSDNFSAWSACEKIISSLIFTPSASSRVVTLISRAQKSFRFPPGFLENPVNSFSHAQDRSVSVLAYRSSSLVISASTVRMWGAVSVASIYDIPVILAGAGRTAIIFDRIRDTVAVGKPAIHKRTSLFQCWYVLGVKQGQLSMTGGAMIIDVLAVPGTGKFEYVELSGLGGTGR